jgi:hypothetical protein
MKNRKVLGSLCNVMVFCFLRLNTQNSEISVPSQLARRFALLLALIYHAWTFLVRLPEVGALFLLGTGLLGLALAVWVRYSGTDEQQAGKEIECFYETQIALAREQ